MNELPTERRVRVLDVRGGNYPDHIRDRFGGTDLRRASFSAYLNLIFGLIGLAILLGVIGILSFLDWLFGGGYGHSNPTVF